MLQSQAIDLADLFPFGFTAQGKDFEPAFQGQNNGFCEPCGNHPWRQADILHLNVRSGQVNLSGFDGVIEVERGQGVSKKNSKLLNLSIDDFVNIFCIGCVMFVSMAKNFQKIIKFSDWGQIIG